MGLIENAGIGIGTGIINNAMQLGQQQDLNQMAIEGSKELSKYNSDLAYEMWEKTNYDAQRKQMEKAGLNVGLMYGRGGAGGGTTNAGSGGNIGVGQANQKTITDGLGIGLQTAQIKNIEADTHKKEVEADVIGGTNRENTEQDTKNKMATEEQTRLENLLKSGTLDNKIKEANLKYWQTVEEVQKIGRENLIGEATINEKIKQIELDTIEATIENELKQSKVELTDEQKRAITEELAQGWERLYIGLKEVGTKQHQNAINEFSAKVNARLGQGNLDQRKIEAALNTAGKIISGGKTVNQQGERRTTINNY